MNIFDFWCTKNRLFCWYLLFTASNTDMQRHMIARMCSEGLIFRKQHANRPTLFDSCANPLDTGKNWNTDTTFFGADTTSPGARTTIIMAKSGSPFRSPAFDHYFDLVSWSWLTNTNDISISNIKSRPVNTYEGRHYYSSHGLNFANTPNRTRKNML